MIALSGCATDPPPVANARPFNFQTDTFAFANDLVWEYHFDEHGKWVSHPREPKPDYTHHCFVVARSARQFFEHARFDPAQPVADDSHLSPVSSSAFFPPARAAPWPTPIKLSFPVMPILRAFSQAQEKFSKPNAAARGRVIFNTATGG